jgi:hypothetical protein
MQIYHELKHAIFGNMYGKNFGLRVTKEDMEKITEYERVNSCRSKMRISDSLSYLSFTRFFLADGKDYDEDFISFIEVLSLYVVSQKGTHKDTHKDMLKILNNGVDVGYVSEIYMDDGNMDLALVCKLFGLDGFRRKCEMDCLRVWDLEKDIVIDNPNIGLANDEIRHKIAAITHRWGPDEITYKHLMKMEQTNAILEALGHPTKSMKISPMSPKLAKIREELKSQIKYVWMDTLCIDKTSSVELDMSIRSMYRWYSDASFVYLEHFTNFNEWCTRGWTLQEGAAAKILRVSPNHGNSFWDLVSKLGDEAHFLGIGRIHGSSSFYWINLMQSRKTTMKEDKAYALIGLLGIDFQIAYGEGKRAIERMCEEVSKQKGDLTWLAVKNFKSLNFADYVKKISPIGMKQEIRVTNLGITVKAICLESGDDYKAIKEDLVYYRIVSMFDTLYCIPSNNICIFVSYGEVKYAFFRNIRIPLPNRPETDLTIKHMDYSYTFMYMN